MKETSDNEMKTIKILVPEKLLPMLRDKIATELNLASYQLRTAKKSRKGNLSRVSTCGGCGKEKRVEMCIKYSEYIKDQKPYVKLLDDFYESLPTASNRGVR